MSTMGIVAIALSAYGAILSTALAVRQWVRDRPQIQVIAQSLLVLSVDLDGLSVLQIRAVNVGTRTVEIDQAVTILADGTRYHPMQLDERHELPGRRMPAALEAGRSAFEYFHISSMKEPRWQPVAVEVTDARGRAYRTKLSTSDRKALADVAATRDPNAATEDFNRSLENDGPNAVITPD